MTAEGLMDLAKLNKKIWLVKVPNHVANSWRDLCEAAMNPTDLEDDAPPLPLGSVRVEVNTEQESTERYKMTLTTPGPTGELQTYKLSQLSQPPGSVMVALSYRARSEDPGAHGTEPSASSGGPSNILHAEGMVDASFNAVPSILADDKVPQSYGALNKERSIKASTKSRTVQAYEDTRENNLNRLAKARTGVLLDPRQRAEGWRRAREEAKRVRLDADVLERNLFALFERQQHWTMSKLAEETRQPAAHLKGVLDKIAVFNKRGPHRDSYQLKKDYTGGTLLDEDEGGAGAAE